MRTFAILCVLALLAQPVMAQPLQEIFRPVSFICRDGATGTAVKIEENIFGNRKRYEVSYFGGKPMLFVISKSTNGRNFARVGLIDLRSERDPENIEAARYLAVVMADGASDFCKGSRREMLSARYQLQANHFFNRQDPRYRGK